MPPLCRIAIPAALALLLVAPQPANADLFTVRAQGETDSVTASGSSLLDLARNLVNQSREFQPLAGQAFTASLDYATLSDALIFTSNAASSQITLEIPSIGFSRTFTDEPGNPVEDQIEDFLRSDGAGTLAGFQRVVNTQTLVGVTDGNPSALTALLANDAFRNFGEYRNPFVRGPQGADSLRIYANYASLRTDAGDGYLIEAALTGGIRITDYVGISLGTPFSYRSIEGSDAYTLGTTLGVPIKPLGLRNGLPVLWQITPHGTIAGGGSADQIAGGVVYGFGATNLLGVEIADDLMITSGQQLSFYRGTPIDVGDYRFETDVDQQILKLSLAGNYGGMSDLGYATAGLVYTRFLDDAAVDDYWTPYVGLGLRIGRNSVLRVTGGADLADGFRAYRGEVELRLTP